MSRRCAIAGALVFALAFSGRPLSASEPPRPLRPEVCRADGHPAITSLAVPPPVRAAAERADRIERGRVPRRSRRRLARWLVAAAAAAGALVLLRSR